MDLSNMSDAQLKAFQQSVYLELNQRVTAQRQQQEREKNTFLDSIEASQLRMKIDALKTRLQLLPKEIDLEKTITLKLKAELSYEDIDDLIQLIHDEEEVATLRIELEDRDNLPGSLCDEIDLICQDAWFEDVPVEEFLAETSEWSSFFKEIRDLESELKPLYDADLTIIDLMND